MNITLFDDPEIRGNLLPFTFTRPVAEVRVGILTITEKWQSHTQVGLVSHLTQGYLQPKYPQLTSAGYRFYVNGAICPTEKLLEQIKNLSVGQSLTSQGMLVALNADSLEFRGIAEIYQHKSIRNSQEYTLPLAVLRQPWNIFQLNGAQIKADYDLITDGRQSQPILDKHTIVYNPENIFLEEGATVKAAVLNAEDGPIYLGKNTQVHEGAIIRGPFGLGEKSHVNIGGKMRGDISIGPFCKVGGEVNNCVFFGHSNKGHEGYLGNSVIGEWCNLGANTNASNLKNNYAPIKIWSQAQGQQIDTGLQFCGLMMADHVKCGINTMFNTATVVGVGANVFGAGFPPGFVPAFSWGGAEKLVTFRLPKFLELAQTVLGRQGLRLTEEEQNIFAHIFEVTQPDRSWNAIPASS